MDTSVRRLIENKNENCKNDNANTDVWLEKIKNKYIRGSLGLMNIAGKLREYRSRQFGPWLREEKMTRYSQE